MTSLDYRWLGRGVASPLMGSVGKKWVSQLKKDRCRICIRPTALGLYVAYQFGE